MSSASHSSQASEQSYISHLPPSQPYRNQNQDHDPYSQRGSESRAHSSMAMRSDGYTSPSSSPSVRPERPERLDRSEKSHSSRHDNDQSIRHQRPTMTENHVPTIHAESSPRASPQRTQRRREPASTSASAANEHLPSLDDYEAMLQQMTSPGLSPSGARSTQRRQDTETRDRTAREPRRARQQQQHQQQQQHEPTIVERRPADSIPPPKVVLPQEERPPSRETDNALLVPLSSEAEQLRARKLRRRSSLPSNLQAPSRLLPPKRRSSGHLSPKDLSHLEELPSSFAGTVLEESTVEIEVPTSSAEIVFTPPPRKRYSWEDESVAARDDLISVTDHKKASSKSYTRNSGSSWQEQLSPVHETRPVRSTLDSQYTVAKNSGEPSQTEKNGTGHRSRSNSPLPPPESVTRLQAGAEVEEDQTHIEHTRLRTPHSSTSSQQRTHTNAPAPSIRPPPGLAPNSAPPPSSPSLTRKISPPSGGKRGVRSGSNASSTLQPSIGHPRPRAGSAASMSSMSSMNSFTLDGILTPPPPSSPLPSLPPAASRTPATSSTTNVGLGIGTKSRKMSGGSREIVVSPPQVVLESADESPLPTPASSEPMTPEHKQAILAVAGAETPIQISKLKKRVSLLEKELANTEIELSSRIRDGSELQFKVEQLTIERDALQSRMKLLEVHIESAKRQDRGRQRESIELDRASLQLQHDQELQEAVKQIQDEKEVLFEALMERQDRSRMEMSAQMETLRRQLIEKEHDIYRLKTEQQDQEQLLVSNSFLGAQAYPHSQDREQDITRLQALQTSLEQELTTARNEIHRLQSLVADQKQSISKDQRLREELEVKIEAMMLMSDDHEQVRQDKTECDRLRHEAQQLRAEKETHEERSLELARELEDFTMRSQHEETLYRSLQDTVQRLTSTISTMEGQHVNALDEARSDHEEAMERVMQEHAEARAEMAEQNRLESEALQSQLRVQIENQFSEEIQELQARERVLWERMNEQSLKNDQLEAQLFLLEKAQATHENEKETMARTNRSLERHLSMQHLQEQENLYKVEELERENAKLRKVLADLDLAAYLSQQSNRAEGNAEEEEADSEVIKTLTTTMYERQQRRWSEQIQLLERKMAKAEEEALRMSEQNMQLKVALELAKRT
ncbi:hypothetical protein BG004_001207 [Podila humilis]|nr:hypothetical protein BG004_001207 [Podila humilis]